MQTARAGRSRLVVFSPMPPLENGIADYAAELLPLLGALRDTTIVVDDHVPQPPPHPNYRVIRLAEYAQRSDEFAQADHLYQVGNNADHVYLLPWLMRRAGIVVLHDVSLHHLFDQATLRYNDVDAYCALLELEYGAPGRLLADQFRDHRWRTRSMFYELPLTRELLGRARAVIVHSLYAANKVQAQQDGLPVSLVRHHVAARALAAGRADARAKARDELGIADDTVLLVSLGFVTRAKQIDVVLRFLHRHRAELPALRYIIAGQDQPQDFDVRSLIRSLGLDDIVEITGYVDEDAFYRHVAASDIIVNLRYPSGGETSGTLIRALGAGCCVVVNDIGSFAEYPDHVCAKVPVDGGVSDAALQAVLMPLVQSSARRRRFAAAAARYMRQTHSIAESVRRYLATLDEHRQRAVLPLAPRTGAAYLPAARLAALIGDLSDDDKSRLPLWASEGFIPVAAARPPTRALLAGAGASDATFLQRVFGYAAPSTDIVAPESLDAAVPAARRRSHRLALLESTLADARASLARRLACLNARLAHDGHLVLTIVEGEGHLTSAVVGAVRSLVEASGFEIEQVIRSRESLSDAIVSSTLDLVHRDNPRMLLMRARKCSEFISTRAASNWSASHASAR